ncbi:MAG: pyridoxal 4-dehydrogenase [Chloroflexi bacterium RBG_16_72_14]|nr:MAG: pyridoxal 4-dehydrogenase [Chloroflexi bacterium RBG_16_72_14]
MAVDDRRPFGRVGFPVSVAGYGGAPIGNLFRPIPEDRAQALVADAWDSGIRYFDTAPLYGHGLSEHRLGHGLLHRPRSEYVLATKVGRRLYPQERGTFDSGAWVDVAPFRSEFEYGYDAVLREVEDSLQRMCTDRLDILFIHDCDVYTHGPADQPARFREAMAGAYPALARLRDEGVVKAIGIGVNEADVCYAAIQEADLDCILLAGRYTLLEQEPLDDLMPACEERGIAVVLGGVFNSGVLATGPVEGAKFNYGPAPAHILDRVRAIQAVCDRHGVPLPAAAVQFAAAHPAVATVCLGARTLEQQRRNAENFAFDIPDALWDELRDTGLIRYDAPAPSRA